MSSGAKLKPSRGQTGNNNKQQAARAPKMVDSRPATPKLSVTQNISHNSNKAGGLLLSTPVTEISSANASNRNDIKSANTNSKIELRDSPSLADKAVIEATSIESQETKKTVHRVNLIKKSSRQSNLVATLAQKRLLKSQQPQTNQAVVKTNDQPKELVNDKQESIPSTKESHDKSQINTYKQAKESQKLVLSLIKDLSKTVSREDFGQISKEIHLALGEAEKENQSNKEGEPVDEGKNVACKRKNSNQKLAKIGKTTTDAKVSNDSERLNQANNKLGNQKSLTNQASNQSTRQSTDESSSYNQKFLEFSSDDDNTSVIKNLDRKPNSSRMPDRCLRLTSSHAKYISPHRKRSLEDRLSRAQEAREKFLEYRANKFKEILKKVEEVKAWKEEDTMNLKASVQTKLQKAAEKRKEQLDKIIRKAHDEDSKVSEIQFIISLEAQNRRYDLNSRKKEMEARLQDLQEERQRKIEEKQAKEVAAEERRKTLEAERKAKLLEIQQRRKIKNQKVEQQQQVREKRRIEKNRDRDQKISAIKEAYHNGVETLKNRINQKQEQSERRLEVNLKLIRQKAFELSIKRYNSFISESNLTQNNKDLATNNTDTNRLQLKPFNTKKFCNLCKETINSELALFSHLRSDLHHSSISQHYGNTMLTTNEAVEIHNLRHIVDTDEPLDSDATSDDQQSSRASSLVNYYHSSYLSQANGGIYMSDNDRISLLAIEKKCRKLRHKLIVTGKPFNRDWFSNKIRQRLAQLLIKQRQARNQSTSTEATSLASVIDLSANNSNCQQNKQFYLKITRINRELISVTNDQRISGGGLMPAGIIHTVDRLLADLNKQLTGRQVPQLLQRLLYLNYTNDDPKKRQLDPDQLASAIKMIEFYAIDTLYLYDIIQSLVSILRRILPNVSKLPSTFAGNSSTTLLDPISMNSYFCHRSPSLPARIYLKMIGLVQNLCSNNSDLCYIVFQSNNIISLSDILSYRLGFIIGNESPASSISGSSSAATLSAHTIENRKQQQQHNSSNFKPTVGREITISGKNKATAPVNKRQQQQQSGQIRKSRLSQHASRSDDDCEDSNDENGNQDDDEDEDDDDQDEHEREDHESWERTETYKRTEEIVDDMTAGLCKLLATITETILERPLVLLDQIDKAAFDQRSDDFISYMVSVGIVDTESVIMSHIHHQQQHHNHQKHQNNHQQQNLSANGQSLGPAAAAAPSNAASSSNLSGPNYGLGLNSATSADCSAVVCGPGHNNSYSNVSNSAHNMSPSANSKIINFTTSCVQFVTSLVKLVIAKLPNGGRLSSLSSAGCFESRENKSKTSASVQQDSTQLLETLKMTQLSGVLTLVYDMLVNSFNSLDNNPASVFAANNPPAQQANSKQQNPETSERQLELALHSLRLINYVAYIDVELMQSTLSSDEMLPLQLRHVCNYLITYLLQSCFKIMEHLGDSSSELGCFSSQTLGVLQSNRRPAAAAAAATSKTAQAQASTQTKQLAPLDNDKKSPGWRSSDLLANELINEIILLLGNFAYLNRDNQLLLKSGRQPTVIEQLIGLPFDYFARSKLKLVLMPTLISCSYLNDQICAIVCQELSLSMLTAFIEDQLLGAQLNSASSQTEAANNRQLCSLTTDDLTNAKLSSARWTFERRFAKCKWLSVKKYFELELAKGRSPN